MDEQARKALQAAMKIPVSQGGFKEKFITEADLLPQGGTKAAGRCDLCGSAIKDGDGYAFFSSAVIEPLNVPVGNMMLCEKCTQDTITERAWVVRPSELQFKPPTTEKDLARMLSGENSQMESLNTGGIVATCKRLGFSPEAAKRKARELAVLWWQDPEKGKRETLLFWTSEPNGGAGSVERPTRKWWQIWK